MMYLKTQLHDMLHDLTSRDDVIISGFKVRTRHADLLAANGRLETAAFT